MQLTSSATKSLQIGLQNLGWQLTSVEIDLDTETCRVELRSGNRLVTLDARPGSASITREAIEHVQATVGRRGDRMPVTRIVPRFIGRTRCDGMRSGFRALASYVADNSSVLLAHSDVRNLFRPLLASSSAKAGAQ